MVCLVCTRPNLPHADALCTRLREQFADIATILLNVNSKNTNVILGTETHTLYGPGYIEDTLCGVPVQLGPLSFYQVNTLAAERLYGIAAQYAQLTPDDLLLDLYCGMGTIGLSMVDHCRELVGVEIVPEAIESAKANAARMGDAGRKELLLLCRRRAGGHPPAAEGLHPDVVMLDPPRKGCDEATLSAVVRMAPPPPGHPVVPQLNPPPPPPPSHQPQCKLFSHSPKIINLILHFKFTTKKFFSKDSPNMMNPRLYTTSYNKPQGQQFDTAVLSFIKLQYTEKSCKMINIFVLVTILGHLPVILFAKRKGSEDMKQILIVEDDSFLNKMVAYNLTADGYGVTSALNARTAAEAIRQREFDLVLLDINLPDGNGFELCKLIKPQHPDTIVIFLTANDQESDQIRGYEVGAVDYITKPFVIGALQRKIKAMFAMLARSLWTNTP